MGPEEEPSSLSTDAPSSSPAPPPGSHRAALIADKQSKSTIHSALQGLVASYGELRHFLLSTREGLDSDLQAQLGEAAMLGGTCSATSQGPQLDVRALATRTGPPLQALWPSCDLYVCCTVA